MELDREAGLDDLPDALVGRGVAVAALPGEVVVVGDGGDALPGEDALQRHAHAEVTRQGRGVLGDQQLNALPLQPAQDPRLDLRRLSLQAFEELPLVGRLAEERDLLLLHGEGVPEGQLREQRGARHLTLELSREHPNLVPHSLEHGDPLLGLERDAVDAADPAYDESYLHLSASIESCWDGTA